MLDQSLSAGSPLSGMHSKAFIDEESLLLSDEHVKLLEDEKKKSNPKLLIKRVIALVCLTLIAGLVVYTRPPSGVTGKEPTETLNTIDSKLKDNADIERTFFKSADADGDEKISSDEFKRFVKGAKALNETGIQKMDFGALDKDGDGIISSTDFHFFLKSTGTDLAIHSHHNYRCRIWI